jgi:hypothetical protein
MAFSKSHTTSGDKQAELHRLRSILLATIDYLSQHNAGSFVTDGYDAIREYFNNQQLQTEKYFRQGRLDKLQQKLRNLTKGPQNRADLQFGDYIHNQTGYTLDLFAEARLRLDNILKKGEILTERDSRDAGTMLFVLEQTGEDPQKVSLLRHLFAKQMHKQQAKKASADPTPADIKEQEAIAPDGKRRLTVSQWTDGKNASTYVSIIFEKATGPIYGTSGLHPDIQASWKDNNTIVITTQKHYSLIGTQHRQVSSFDDVINIEYIEH